MLPGRLVYLSKLASDSGTRAFQNSAALQQADGISFGVRKPGERSGRDLDGRHDGFAAEGRRLIEVRLDVIYLHARTSCSAEARGRER